MNTDTRQITKEVLTPLNIKKPKKKVRPKVYIDWGATLSRMRVGQCVQLQTTNQVSSARIQANSLGFRVSSYVIDGIRYLWRDD